MIDDMVTAAFPRWVPLCLLADEAGVDMTGKSVEQVIDEINEANRPYREWAEEQMAEAARLLDDLLTHTDIPAPLRRIKAPT